jgi:hypothetical protein
MGFNLWGALGVPPVAGIAIVIGGVVAAGLVALGISRRNRAGPRGSAGFSLRDALERPRPREDRTTRPRVS